MKLVKRKRKKEMEEEKEEAIEGEVEAVDNKFMWRPPPPPPKEPVKRKYAHKGREDVKKYPGLPPGAVPEDRVVVVDVPED